VGPARAENVLTRAVLITEGDVLIAADIELPSAARTRAMPATRAAFEDEARARILSVSNPKRRF
jgi:hypothetical protein